MNIGDTVQFRFATRDDVPAIIAMLADDILGSEREGTSRQDEAAYYKAFEEMESQDGNQYLLAVDQSNNALGCLQITIISGLSRSAMKRAQIEGVRVAARSRGTGIGKALIAEAHAIARRRGCGLVQLTTDRSRPDALRFYEDLGYENSHHGLKFLFQ